MKKTDAKPTKYVPTKIKLARACKVSRQTLARYLKMPDAPMATDQGWSLEAVKHWILQHARGTNIAARIDPKMAALKKWEIYERARRLHDLNEREIESLMPVTEVEREWTHCISECERVFLAIPARLAPEIVGITVPAAEQLLKRAIDEATREIHDGNS